MLKKVGDAIDNVDDLLHGPQEDLDDDMIKDALLEVAGDFEMLKCLNEELDVVMICSRARSVN